MGLNGWIGDLRETQRNLSELLSENTAEEQAASLEIAQSASRFSRRTRQVVDDKLTFSATLMRAGEVSAATRLLAEVEQEVREEEIALIETVNEVKVAQAVRRGRITRLRLARSMAVAMLGACVLAFSAVGMAVAGAFKERARTEAIAPLQVDGSDGLHVTKAGTELSDQARRLMRRLKIGNVNLVLTHSEFRMLKELTGGSVDHKGLSDVIGLLPNSLAEKVQEVISIASSTVTTEEPTLAVETAPVTKKVVRAKKKVAGSSQQTSDNESADEPAEEPSEEPSNEPSPSPSEKEEEGDEAGGNNEGGSTTVPLPGFGL